MEQVIEYLDELKDHYALSLQLEPYLPLIKSQTLNKLYIDFKYNKGMYREYLPILVNESTCDYRLETLLKKFHIDVLRRYESVRKLCKENRTIQ